MAKFSDKIILSASAAVLFYIGGAYITDSYVLGIVFAAMGVLAVISAMKVLPKRQKTIGLSQFTTMLLLEGKEVSNSYLRILYPPESEENRREASEVVTQEKENRDEYIASDGQYVINAIGYAKAGEEWAAKLYRKLKPDKYAVVLAAIDVDRKALATLNLVATQIKVIRPKEMLKRLKKANVRIEYDLPKTKVPLRTIISTLSLRHAKLFALASICCLTMSIWLPVKTYYYIFAAVNALLAIVITILKKAVKE